MSWGFSRGAAQAPQAPQAAQAAQARALGCRLLEVHDIDVVDQRQGGNNRLYRLIRRGSAGDGFAVKFYPLPGTGGDRRDRLATETRAIRLLRKSGINMVPHLYGADAHMGAALFEWIAGEAIAQPDATDVADALTFIRLLRERGRHDDAAAVPAASAACFSLADIYQQIDDRLARLTGIAALQPFIEEDFQPAYRLLQQRCTRDLLALGISVDMPCPLAHRLLSPSDFGFHNALRRSDGLMTFLDLEYFGWDDSVKLAADFCLHPGHRLPAGLADQFIEGMACLFDDSHSWRQRFTITKPLYGLIWCLIMLNPFLDANADTGLQHDRLTQVRTRLAQLNGDLDHAA